MATVKNRIAAKPAPQPAKAGNGYAALARRYGLPGEDMLCAVFDVPSLEKERFPLREAVKKVAERLDWCAQVLEGIIQPEHLAGLNETDAIPDAVKKDALSLYRDVMFLFRETQLQIISTDEAGHARFLKDTLGSYPAMQARLESILRAMRDSWKNPSGAVPKHVTGQDRQSAGYFG